MKQRYFAQSLAISLGFLLMGTALIAQPFYNPLPVPPLVHQTSNFQLTMTQEPHDFDPDSLQAGFRPLHTPLQTFAFNQVGDPLNSYLGPTLQWLAGDVIHIRVVNGLSSTSSVHWHGAHVPMAMDGGPHTTIPGGGFKDHTFDVKDETCTLWYHPHPHGNTMAQVNMGLAGVIIVQNDNFHLDSLPDTYGVDDFPLIVESKKFVFDSLTGMAVRIDTIRSSSQNSGLTQMVNGVINPYLEVPPQAVRLRILDASARLVYQFGIAEDSVSVPNETWLPINIIASDAGYLDGTSARVDSFVTAPGIRSEIIVDFTGKAGLRFYLRNLSRSLPTNMLRGQAKPESFMEIRVGSTPTAQPGFLPVNFPVRDTLPYNSLTKRRNKRLWNLSPNSTPVNGYYTRHMIDSAQFDMHVINDTILLDSVEIWRIANTSTMAHPFHIHDVSFKVLKVETVDANGNATGQLPLRPEHLGPKDDILIYAGQAITFITKFSEFATEPDADSCYMYHCHILTHEDGYMGVGGPQGHPDISQRYPFGMMHQFVVTTPALLAQANAALFGPNITMFPNPATELLHFKGDFPKASHVRIIDLQGRTLMEQNLKPFTGATAIDISSLNPGMVLVEFQSDKGSVVNKVIIE